MKSFRSLFHIPQNPETGRELKYFCGHSLGLQPKTARESIEKEMEVWEKYAVEGHFKEGSQWFSFHEKVSASLAKIIGAKKSEVVAMNSLTVNLHLMLVSFLRPTAKRYKILTDAPCFPSDKYALDSNLRFHGLDPAESLIKFETFQEDRLATTEDWINVITRHRNELCLVYINPVNYLTGQFFDIQAISEACKKYDITLGLDLAHSIGNVELKLNEWAIDFAIWCSYKYLNGGPGAIGGCYVNERRHHEILPRFEGWWGTKAESRFQMQDRFDPSSTAEAWQLSNPPILMIAALRASLDIFEQTTMQALAERGEALTRLFIEKIEAGPLRDQLSIINAKVKRGNMLCLKLNTSRDFSVIQKEFLKEGVILDHRKPDILRVSFCPLYNAEEEVISFVDVLSSVLLTEESFARSA